MPTHTPWGQSQTSTKYARGIIFYSTSSHGGFHLSKTLNAQIPSYMRNADGWYEEDCEWAKVGVVFASAFSQEHFEIATRTMKNWFPNEYRMWSGQEVLPEESYMLRTWECEKENYNNYTARTGFGDWVDWVPKGMVGVRAVRASDGAEGYWLVPEREYYARVQATEMFVVDESRDTRVREPLPIPTKKTKEVAVEDILTPEMLNPELRVVK